MIKKKVTKQYPPEFDEVKKHPYIKDCLIYDIETDGLDTESANVKWIGYYSYKDNKYHILPPGSIQEFQEVINSHRVIIGFNNKNFDDPIITNHGMSLEYKTIMDLRRVLWNPDFRKVNRKGVIQLPNGMSLEKATSSNSLKNVCKALDFDVAKGDIDYKIFRQESWTDAEVKSIEQYLIKDLMLTKKLFEYLLKYFDNFREYVPESNIRKFHYIKSSLGSYAYSVICHLTGMEELYSEEYVPKLKYPGGFVKEITRKEAHGTILYLDFASLYPHIFIQCNLFSVPQKGKPTWDGDNIFPVKGTYDCSKQGPIETVLKKMLLQRIEFKKNKDPRQLALKIVLNTAYGLTGSPNFLQVHHAYNAEDCTQIGAHCIKYADKIFRDNGFEVLYGDTDSSFLFVPSDKTKDEALRLCKTIVESLQSHMPFPMGTWKLDLEDEIKHIWFFGKKNYAYINIKDELVIKGLPVIKGNASLLGQKIFDQLKPLMVENQSIKFDRVYIEMLIMDEIRKDFTIIAQLYKVRSPKDYKSQTSIQYQIAKEIGEGNHLLIPNKSYGNIGKVKNYLPISQYEKLTMDDLILEKVYNELEPFTK